MRLGVPPPKKTEGTRSMPERKSMFSSSVSRHERILCWSMDILGYRLLFLASEELGMYLLKLQ